MWRQDTTKAAEPRAKISRAGLRWGLVGIVCQHLSMARVAEGLGVSWNTANTAVLAEGRRVLIADPHRLDGVRIIGVDEHVVRHTRRGDKYVTVIIDLTPVRDGTGPARLLDMVQGRPKKAFKTWLAERDQSWRDGVEVVAMDGFTGFTTAATEELPDATTVMDPFYAEFLVMPMSSGSVLVGATTGLVRIYDLGVRGVDPSRIGLVSSVLGAGMLIGASAAATVVSRFPSGWVAVTGMTMVGVAVMVLPWVTPFWATLAVLFTGILGAPACNAAMMSYFMHLVPRRLLGRALSGASLLSGGATPLAPVLAGLGLAWLGLWPTLIVAGAICLVAVLVLVTDRGLRNLPRPADWPEPPAANDGGTRAKTGTA